MASEKAKELAAKQKAAIKAEKLRKKNSDDPRDWGQVRQLREAYKRTAEIDPAVTWWMLGVGVGVAAVIAIIGGAVAWAILGEQRAKNAALDSISGDVAAASCDPITNDPADGSGNHVGPGTSQPEIVVGTSVKVPLPLLKARRSARSPASSTGPAASPP